MRTRDPYAVDTQAKEGEGPVSGRTQPKETKLVICVWHPFTEWRPKPMMAEAIRKRWPEMRVLHLPNYDGLPNELADMDIFVGYSLRAEQLKDGKKLKWIHSTAADVAQLMSQLNVTNAMADAAVAYNKLLQTTGHLNTNQ